MFFNGSGGTLIGAAATDGSGNLAPLNVAIPVTVTGGTYQIFATDGTNTATTTFTVPSGLTLTPNTGGPGISVSVSGTGFVKDESVIVGWDQAGNQVASGTANGNGGISTSFSVPSSSGTHAVFATGQSSHFVVTATFNVSGNVGGANLSLSPTSGVAGSTVSVNGTGFSATEQVNVEVDGGVVLSTTSDGNGNFATSITLPPSLAIGSHTISATGASSGHSAFATFSVTSVGQQATSCVGDDDERPGNGFGDDNHCHTGPPGQQKHDDDNSHGQGHGNHGHGNDKGDDD
jgi:hypothetical protein